MRITHCTCKQLLNPRYSNLSTSNPSTLHPDKQPTDAVSTDTRDQVSSGHTPFSKLHKLDPHSKPEGEQSSSRITYGTCNHIFNPRSTFVNLSTAHLRPSTLHPDIQPTDAVSANTKDQVSSVLYHSAQCLLYRHSQLKGEQSSSQT